MRWGSLRNLIIQPRTLKRYTVAMLAFFEALTGLAVGLPDSPTELDDAMCSFIDLCWEEGEARGLAADAVCAAQHFVPGVRRHLQGSSEW